MQSSFLVAFIQRLSLIITLINNFLCCLLNNESEIYVNELL